MQKLKTAAPNARTNGSDGARSGNITEILSRITTGLEEQDTAVREALHESEIVAASLKDTARQAEAVATASEQMVSSMNEMAASTEQVTANVAQVASASTQITASVKSDRK